VNNFDWIEVAEVTVRDFLWIRERVVWFQGTIHRGIS
jgi:hypothetical protein